MVTIPVTTIKQTAKAYTYCSHTRGKVQVWLQSWLPRCAERVEFTTMDAIKWWGQFLSASERSYIEYCNGYQIGYRTSWNTWLYDYNNGLYPFQRVSDPIHCGIQGWPSCYSVGYSGGWYHAQGDWNTLQYGLYSYGNSACPRGHSILYCNGYHAGYIDLWNHWIYNQENWINFVNTSQRSQQVCSIINGPGVMCM